MPYRTLVAAIALALAAGPFQARAAGKKVLFVTSYHQGYEWSDGEETGAKSILEPAGFEVKFVRMDAKRHEDEAFRKEAGRKAKAQIEAYKPDVVIVADDVAVSYLLVPYFKDAHLPFVFCGVNWDAKKYGLPFKNATGMVEVSLGKNLINTLKEYAKGTRVGFLNGNSETDRVEGEHYRAALKEALGLSFASERYVGTMAEWKEAFAKMQGEVDVLLFDNFAAIKGWDERQAVAFAAANSRIPSGTTMELAMPYVMLGYTKVAEEQGIWAAKTAIEILKGTPPDSIPVVTNKQAKILINPKLASKAGVVFNPDLVRNAHVAAR